MQAKMKRDIISAPRLRGPAGGPTTEPVPALGSVAPASAVSLLGRGSARPCRGSLQIPPDLVVKSQVADIIDSILQLIRCPNGVYRACRKRKSRGALLGLDHRAGHFRPLRIIG